EGQALAKKKAASKKKAKKVAQKAAPKKVAKAPKAAKPAKPAKVLPKGKKGKGDDVPTPQFSAPRKEGAFLGPMPDKPMPRASKLPGQGEPLTKREMEQLLTVGLGRGVQGEG